MVLRQPVNAEIGQGTDMGTIVDNDEGSLFGWAMLLHSITICIGKISPDTHNINEAILAGLPPEFAR